MEMAFDHREQGSSHSLGRETSPAGASAEADKEALMRELRFRAITRPDPPIDDVAAARYAASRSSSERSVEADGGTSHQADLAVAYGQAPPAREFTPSLIRGMKIHGEEDMALIDRTQLITPFVEDVSDDAEPDDSILDHVKK